MNNPLVSIIIPCYNQSQYLDECLESVFKQSYSNWECIIVNDGSEDETENIAKRWLDIDPRFRYLYKKNGGLSSARNAGIFIAKGGWILPLDSDDKIVNDYLELASLQFDNGYTVIYCKAKLFGTEDGDWLLNDFNLKDLAVKNMIFCTAFFRKSDWDKVGGYDENLKHGFEDWEFWISILKDNGLVYKIPQVCFFYRKKETSMLTKISSDNYNQVLTRKYIYSKHYEFFINILETYDVLYEYKYKYEALMNTRGQKLIKFLKFILYRFKHE